jgi:hypothetical protein
VVKLTDKEGNVYFYEVESMEVVGLMIIPSRIRERKQSLPYHL